MQGDHIHFIHFVVEAPDQLSLTRAMKGLEVRMARALNRVMDRKGPVFSDRCHATPADAAGGAPPVELRARELAHPRAREGQFVPPGEDPYNSAADSAGTRRAEFWMLRVGIWRRKPVTAAP